MDESEAQRRVNENCALLLVAHSDGKTSKLMDSVKAGEMLGRISMHPSGLGGPPSYQIPVDAVEKAGLIQARWDRAVETGLLRLQGSGRQAVYELPSIINTGEHEVPTTLVQHLETISGITHDAAIGNARRFSSSGRDASGKAR